MKQIRILLLLIIVLTTNVVAQNNPTFDRSYDGLDYHISYIEENSDGTFLLHGTDYNNSHCMIKTDPEGFTLWKKEFRTSTIRGVGWRTSQEMILPSEHNTVYVLSKKINNYMGNTVVRELDKEGVILFEKEYENTDSTICHEIEKLSDGYCFSHLNRNENTLPDWKVLLIKTDNEFNEVWRKKILTESSYVRPSLAKLNDSSFCMTSKTKIMKYKNNGDFINSFPFSGSQAIETINDSIILCGKETTLIALDYSGDELWQTSGGYIELLNQRIFTRSRSGDNLFELNISGEIINQVELNSSLHSIAQTDEDDLLIGGWNQNTRTANFTKTENNLQYEAVDLLLRTDSQYLHNNTNDSITVFHSFSTNKIKWFNTNNINYIDLEYSTNSGADWGNIVNYFPADTGYFNWDVPDNFTENGILRIKESLSGIYNDKKKIKIVVSQNYDYISINEMFMWIGNNGDGSHSPLTDGSGLYWPGGEISNKALTYEDGLMWGLKVNGEIRVNGNTHRQGIRPGIIKEDGTAGDPFNPEYKIYKIKKDWQLLPPSIERDRYKYDYINWPTQNGAPFTDNDYDGIYTPFVDEPDWHGDEMLFYVANDLDSTTSLRAYGSPPIGLEQQCLIYGYDKEDELKDVVFKKFRIINKSENDWTDMYLSYWTDDDMGDAGDDFVGCDTLLNMGYTYNGDEEDYTYGIPPAVGHMFLQGPISQSTGDSAIFKGRIKHNYKNIPITNHSFYIGGSATYQDPYQGVYQGTLEFYNQMQGKLWNGFPVVDPNTGDTTTFILSGDPVTGTGWYEGDGWPDGPSPADRRALISSGTFTLAAGDTQEVVIAIMAAQGTDRLNSVTELKNTARIVREFYYGQFITDVNEENNNQPISFKLEQNYPNPFNPSTKINYSIPLNRTNSNSSVRLIVYDVLGKEVARLVDEKKSPGNYEVVFNASALSSGVYFYRLQTEMFTQTKKMILLK